MQSKLNFFRWHVKNALKECTVMWRMRMHQSKTMYYIEKFLVTECPNCRHLFKKEDEDWWRLFGDIIDGQKVIREIEGYHIVICEKCGNHTAQILLESYQLANKEKAVAFCQEEGFCNLIEVQAFGNMTQDSHSVHTEKPGMKIMAVKCEEAVSPL